MELLSVSFGVFFWHTMALVCVFIILKKFAFKTILVTLEQRRKKIENGIVYAKQVEAEKQNMEALKIEYDRYLENEKSKALQEVKAMKEEVLLQAKVEAEKIKEGLVKKAVEEVQQMKAYMQGQYNAQLAAMAIKISERLLQHELSDENKQALLIDSIISELNMQHNRHV